MGAIPPPVKTGGFLAVVPMNILWANSTAAKSVNMLPEEMVGHTCHSLWADPLKPCENCPSLKAFKTGKSENTIIHNPNGTVWQERGEPIYDENKNIIGVIEIAHNITNQMNLVKGGDCGECPHYINTKN